jgi:hypothetical protein
MLLLLVAHAFIVSATHSHRVRLVEDALLSGSAVVQSDSDASAGLESGAHAQCLLCRLQRSLIADLYSPASVYDASLQKFACGEASPTPAHANEAFLLPAGRAPPLA